MNDMEREREKEKGVRMVVGVFVPSFQVFCDAYISVSYTSTRL